MMVNNIYFKKVFFLQDFNVGQVATQNCTRIIYCTKNIHVLILLYIRPATQF